MVFWYRNKIWKVSMKIKGTSKEEAGPEVTQVSRIFWRV